MPLTVETDAFFDEVIQTFDRASGPVDSFTYTSEVKKRLLDHAVETGEIDTDTFTDCPVFDREEEKKARFEAMRAKGILNTLEHMDPEHIDLQRSIELAVAQSHIDMFVVVESARQLQLIKSGRMEDPYYQHARDEHGNATKGRTDFLREVLHEALGALYNKPEKKIVDYSLSLGADAIKKAETTPAEGQAADFMAAFTSDYGAIFEHAHQAEKIALNPQKAAEMRAELQRQFGPHFTALREEFGGINNDKIVPVANRLLELMEYADLGWKAVENTEINGFKVVRQKLELQCGNRSKEITWDIFEQLMTHEIGKHMVGAINGGKSGFKPLQMGLPGSTDAEEGGSILFEKIWKGEITFDTLERDHFRYITDAYASGMVDGQPHGPNETFRFISQFMTMNSLSKETYIDDQEFKKRQTAQRKAAFEHVFRTYRGMPEGEVMTKNSGYLAGKLGLIESINNSPMPGDKIVQYLQCGKFDPNKPQDREIVSQVWQLTA